MQPLLCYTLCEGGLIMSIREGAIPTILGSVVTGAGAAMMAIEMAPIIAAGVVGFGAAHIVLGAIDLVEHKHHKR
jgi:hypothetical protein